jgi:hypothetical protein
MLGWLSSIGGFVFVVSVGLAGVFLFVLVFKNKKSQISAVGLLIAILILGAGIAVYLGDLLDAKQGAQHVFSTCFGSVFSVPAVLLGGRKIWEQFIVGKDGRPNSTH